MWVEIEQGWINLDTVSSVLCMKNKDGAISTVVNFSDGRSMTVDGTTAYAHIDGAIKRSGNYPLRAN